MNASICEILLFVIRRLRLTFATFRRGTDTQIVMMLLYLHMNERISSRDVLL